MKRLMGIVLALLILAMMAACASAPPTFDEITRHPLYKYVRQENIGKIMEGQCAIGMNAPECAIAWKGDYFEPVSESENRPGGFYDIYRVNHGGKSVYLHFQNLILVRIAEYEPRR